MSLRFSPYELKSENEIRKGVLLRVTDESGNYGYADLHQWPLDMNSTQAQISLANARQDLEWRRQSKSAWERFSNTHIINNYLFTDITSFERETFLQKAKEALDLGFRTFKVKVGRNPKIEIPLLRAVLTTEKEARWRLDFNCRLKANEASDFFMSWTSAELARLEYVEDPCPYDLPSWSKLNKKVPLALDQAWAGSLWPWDEKWNPADDNSFQQLSFRHLIIKPATQDLPRAWRWSCEKNLKVTVTSFMDHPLGVAATLQKVLEIKKYSHPVEAERLNVCGLRTSFLFEPSEFSKMIETSDPELLYPEGTGLGFDSLLKELPWLESL